jgi:hypothetical protein
MIGGSRGWSLARNDAAVPAHPRRAKYFDTKRPAGVDLNPLKDLDLTEGWTFGFPSARLGIPSARLGNPSDWLGFPSAQLGIPSVRVGSCISRQIPPQPIEKH